jgi:hypothetical protein
MAPAMASAMAPAMVPAVAGSEIDGMVENDDFGFDEGELIPGRIASGRWIDLSRGRPHDLGYRACI